MIEALSWKRPRPDKGKRQIGKNTDMTAKEAFCKRLEEFRSAGVAERAGVACAKGKSLEVSGLERGVFTTDVALEGVTRTALERAYIEAYLRVMKKERFGAAEDRAVVEEDEGKEKKGEAAKTLAELEHSGSMEGTGDKDGNMEEGRKKEEGGESGSMVVSAEEEERAKEGEGVVERAEKITEEARGVGVDPDVPLPPPPKGNAVGEEDVDGGNGPVPYPSAENTEAKVPGTGEGEAKGGEGEKRAYEGEEMAPPTPPPPKEEVEAGESGKEGSDGDGQQTEEGVSGATEGEVGVREGEEGEGQEQPKFPKVRMPKEGDEGDVGAHPELNGEHEMTTLKVRFRIVPEDVKDEKKDDLTDGGESGKGREDGKGGDESRDGGSAMDAGVKRGMEKTPVSKCRAKNPILCRNHGIQAMKDAFGDILERHGLTGVHFEISRVLEDGEVGDEGAVAHELAFDIPKSMADTVGKAIIREFGKLNGIDLADPDDALSMTEYSGETGEMMTLFDTDGFDKTKDEPDISDDNGDGDGEGDGEGEGGGGGEEEEEEEGETEEVVEKPEPEPQPAPERESDGKEEVEPSVEAGETSGGNNEEVEPQPSTEEPKKEEAKKEEAKKEEPKKEEAKKEEAKPEQAEKKEGKSGGGEEKKEGGSPKPRRRHFFMGGFSDDDGPSYNDEYLDEKKDEPVKEYKPDQSNPLVRAKDARTKAKELGLGESVLEDLNESVDEYKKAKRDVDYLEGQLLRSLPSEAVRKDLEERLQEKKEMMESAAEMIDFACTEIERRSGNNFETTFSKMEDDFMELDRQTATYNNDVGDLLVSMKKKEIPADVEGKDDYLGAAFAYEDAKADYEIALDDLRTMLFEGREDEGLATAEDLKEDAYRDLQKKAEALRETATKVANQLRERQADTKRDVTARLNESRHSYDHAAGLPGETVDGYIKRMKELGRDVPPTLPNLPKRVSAAEKELRMKYAIRQSVWNNVQSNFKKTIANVLDNSSVGTLIGMGGLKGLFAPGGRLKNFFETGHTGAGINPSDYVSYRQEMGKHHFGIKEGMREGSWLYDHRSMDKDGDPADYEKYGCLMSKNPTEDFEKGNMHNNYGGCFVRLKKDRVCPSITIGDSLTDDPTKNATFATDPSLVCVTNYNQYDMPRAIKELDKKPLDVHTPRELCEAFGCGGMYVETQFHGTVDADCVESLNFDDEASFNTLTWNPDVVEAVKKRGIPVMIQGKVVPPRKIKVQTL